MYTWPMPATETVWPAKADRVTKWPFTESVPTPGCRNKSEKLSVNRGEVCPTQITDRHHQAESWKVVGVYQTNKGRKALQAERPAHAMTWKLKLSAFLGGTLSGLVC